MEYLLLRNSVTGIFGLIWLILVVIGMWKIFEKAGEPGWKALIPIYDYYILYKISWTPSMFWGWVVCTLIGGFMTSFFTGFLMYIGMAIALLAAVIQAALWFNVCSSFNKGLLFFLGLLFFNPLFVVILGFSSARYYGNRYARGY